MTKLPYYNFLEWVLSTTESDEIREESHIISVVRPTGAWTHHTPSDPRLREAIDEKLTVYWRVSPLRDFPEEGRGRKYDPGIVPVFWLDIDLSTKESTTKSYPTDQQAQEILSKLPPPSAVINSGRGYYPLWKFTSPLPSQSPETQQLLVDLHNAVLPHWTSQGLDLDQVCDVSRVLRLPGSYNSKYPEIPQITVNYHPDSPSYTPEQLLTAFQSSTKFLPKPPKPLLARDPHTYSDDSPTRSDAFKRICNPNDILSASGFTDQEGNPNAHPHDTSSLQEPHELFNPDGEEYPSRRSAVLNPSGVVYCYGTPPSPLEGLLHTGEGVTLLAIAKHLNLQTLLQEAEEAYQDDLTEFSQHLTNLLETGELPPDYPYTEGLLREAHVLRMAQQYLEAQQKAGNHGGPFPAHLLPESLQSLVHEVTREYRIPGGIPATYVFTAISSMCMGRFQVPVENMSLKYLYPNVYGMVGAPTGVGKSSLDRIFFEPTFLYDQELARQYRSRARTLNERMLKLQHSQERTPDEEEELAEIEELLSTERPTVFMENFTPQAFTRKVVTPIGVMVFSPEMSTIENYFKQDKHDFTNEMLKGWSGDYVKIGRVGDDFESGGIANTTVLLVGQPGIVDSWLFDDNKTQVGLTPRFLVANMGNEFREFQSKDPSVSNEKVAAFHKVITEGYRRFSPLDPNYRPTNVIITTEAWRELSVWKQSFVAPLSNDRLNAPLRPFLDKHHQYPLRISALLAVYEWLENPFQGHEVPVIQADHMIRATKIMEWYTHHILRYVGESVSDDAAELLLLALEASKKASRNDGSFTATEVFRTKTAHYKSASEARVALDTLATQGYTAGVSDSKARYVVTAAGRQKALGTTNTQET